MVKKIYDLATDVANLCVFARLSDKEKIRKMILQTVIIAINSYRSNPDVLEELEDLVKTS